MKKLLEKIFRKRKFPIKENVEIEIGNGWLLFDNGMTIGKKGSEKGVIIFDQENQNGARITLEENAGKIPFAITFGVYGLLFHTEYFDNIKSAKEYIEQKKLKISEFLNMYEIEDEKRDLNWDDKHDDLLGNLI